MKERSREMDVNCFEKVNYVQEEEEVIERLKERIKSHALLRLLIETHLDCLKVISLVDIGDDDGITTTTAPCEAADQTECNTLLSSDLDKFMEDQCMALRKLKEAMEMPIQESLSFINTMYLQLN